MLDSRAQLPGRPQQDGRAAAAGNAFSRRPGLTATASHRPVCLTQLLVRSGGCVPSFASSLVLQTEVISVLELVTAVLQADPQRGAAHWQ